MLSLQDLSFRYPDSNQHWRFSFSVAPGQCLAIDGPSGAGKSTLMNLVAGFLTPDAGEILWNTRSLTPLPPWQRPVTSVFQEHNLFEHLDVRTNIGLGLHPGLKLTPAQKQDIETALAAVGLAGFGDRMPGDLSGGQRQRVALVRALLRQQPVLLLDEPMTGLDAEARKTLRALILKHKAEGTAILLASHDEEDRQILADLVFTL